MKSKVIIYCLVVLSIMTLSGCKKNNDDFVDKYVGSYTVKISPNFNLTYPGQGSYYLNSDVDIETNCVITNNDNNVTISIEGVNGIIDDITMTGYCDGFSLRLNDSRYNGTIKFSETMDVECEINLKGTSISVPYNGIMSWESSISGSCDADISGLGQTTQCSTTGRITFVATEK